MTECSVCGGPLGRDGCAGVCATCLSPEALAHRVQNMSASPLRDVLLRGGESFGLFGSEDTPASHRTDRPEGESQA